MPTRGKIMACESDKCDKYGMHHDYKNGVEIRKCIFCIKDNQPERASGWDQNSGKASDDVGISEIDMRCSEHSNERE